MRFGWLLLAVCVIGLALSTQIPPSAEQVRQATAYFDATEVERGIQFSRERRWFYWADQGLHLVVLLVLVFSPVGTWLTARVRLWSGGRWLLMLLILAAIYLALTYAVSVPLRMARHMHLTAWGIARQTWPAWWRDQALGLGIFAVSSLIPLVCLYFLLRKAPRTWWLWSALGATGLAVVYSYLFPILVAPLFNTFTPIRETPWKELEPRVHALIAKAGVQVGDILVVDASRRSSHTNAYFAGFGPSRQIVLYDTLLRAHQPEEIDTILAHELGHWKHDHIAQGVILGGIAALIGFLVLRSLLRRAVARGVLGMTSPGDPAGLYLLLLLIWAGEWLVMPISNAVSRHFERQADRVSLELTNDPDAFIKSEQTLAKENIGNVTPTAWNVWLFATHPPYLERIEMARRFKVGS